MRLFKFGSRLLWGRLTGNSYPFLVQFSITNRCNSRCQYCYATYYARPTEDLRLAQVKAVIDDLADAGIFRLNIAGGEPLIRDDIGEIVEHAGRKGIYCTMTTNGILVPRKIDVVRKLNIVCFSIDGSREGNDLNRGHGAFDKAIMGMDACRREGIPIRLSAVLTRHTVHDVDFMIDLAEKYCCRVAFTTLISQQREKRESDNTLLPDNEALRGALKRILELKKQGKPILFSAQSYEYALAWPDYAFDIIVGEPPAFSAIKCYAGRFYCLIDYNGDVYPCPQLVGLFKPGNVLRDGFREAFRKAVSHNCRACSMPCSIDFNLFFGLRPRVVLDQFLGWKR